MERRRTAVAAALTAACALTVLVSSAGIAAAEPPPPPVSPPASGKSLEEVRLEMETLYQKAGAATDAYNLAEEQAKKQSGEIVKLAKSIVDGEKRIAALKNQAGAQARAQYRSGGLPAGAQLMLSGDPKLFLDGVNLAQQSQKAAKDLLGQLTQTQEDLKTYTSDASTNWQKLENTRLRQAKAKKQINKQIAAAKKLESELAAEQRARLAQLERDSASRAQAAWLGSGVLKDIGGSGANATARARAAIAFATAQIGKPYEWGAEGPDTFDCSGLTQQAWAAAGQPIPRTSQEQWRLLPRVDVSDMRPGDLIIYHADASHVGMYIGSGSIIHSPRPGRNVTVAGAGSMAILGVVRP
ncbi:NlpC/P60 family protein [Streptomyces sp. NPDC050504]|uniref:C40 family peptidase n=1 Tax=Streptomyces sp. NPDC050504 TaxID=3365618 RepID=UPI003791C468